MIALPAARPALLDRLAPTVVDRIGRWFVVLALLALLAPGTAGAAGGQGAALYAAQCARCHGVDAKGDGPEADFFVPRAPSLRGGRLAAYDVAMLARVIREGEPRPLAVDVARLRVRVGDTEDLVAYLRRLPELDWRRVERGEELFAAKCESCHGRWGRPGPAPSAGARQPRDLSDPTFQRATDDSTLTVLVRHGTAGMPAVPGVRGDDDVAALVAFVRMLSPGYELYSRYCATCHGDDGHPAELAESSARPLVAFDRRYFQAKDPEALQRDVWHMAREHKPTMPHLRGRLTTKQAEAIATHLYALVDAGSAQPAK